MVSPIGAPAKPPVGAVDPSKTGLAGSVDFQTFLLMLTTQLENQDPLNPIEGTDFAVQLATFSTVEQQARTNKLLERLIGNKLEGVVNWIDKEVSTTAPVWFEGKPLELTLEPKSDADAAVLIVTDSRGKQILREKIPAKAGIADWHGIDASGKKLPDGLYKFHVVSLQDGKIIGQKEVPAFTRVEGTKTSGDEVQLVLKGGSLAKLSQVDVLRNPVNRQQPGETPGSE